MFICLFVYSFIRLFVPPPVLAQEASPWYAGSPQEYGQALEDTSSVHKEGYDMKTQVDLQNALTCQIVGCSSNPDHSFYYGKSAIAGIGNYIAMMYATPPADLALWIRDTGQTLGFIPRQAYAQGIGFSGLAPLLPIWKAFRNIAYLLLALVMIAIGFMVMFRKKIDPKTVVTVQNALPKIVITLLLITFSYAIVGLLIDLMYLVMVLLISILVNASGGRLGPGTQAAYLGGGLKTTLFALFGGGMSAVDDLVKMFFYNNPRELGNILKDLILNVLSVGIYFLAQYALVGFIVAIALLFGFIRIVFMLLSAYIQIIIALLVGPLQLLTEALPGSSSFSSWFKNLIANLSVYPVTAGMLLIGTILTQDLVVDKPIWVPPLLSGGEGVRGMVGLIGLGVILTIPGVVGSIKEALKAKAPIAAGPGAVFGPLGAGVGQVIQLGYQAGIIRSAFFGGRKDEITGPGTTPLGRAMTGQRQGMGQG